MNKIELVKQAIENATNHISGLPPAQMDVPALTSVKIRHLMNNLGKISTRYLECGPHKGGTFTAAIANNNLEAAVAVDSFESDNWNEDKAMPQFLANTKAFLPAQTKFHLEVGKIFELENQLPYAPFDFYFYDADHSYYSQREHFLYYKPYLAEEFICVVDDVDAVPGFGLEDVMRGTRDGIEAGGYEVLFEQILKTNGSHDNDSWWNGFGVFILKHKP